MILFFEIRSVTKSSGCINGLKWLEKMPMFRNRRSSHLQFKSNKIWNDEHGLQTAFRRCTFLQYSNYWAVNVIRSGTQENVTWAAVRSRVSLIGQINLINETWTKVLWIVQRQTWQILVRFILGTNQFAKLIDYTHIASSWPQILPDLQGRCNIIISMLSFRCNTILNCYYLLALLRSWSRYARS